MLGKLLKSYIYPIVVFSGGMIGVGFLSLPYISLQVGIWPMVFYFLAITALIVFINLIFCKISIKTPDFKRLPGFVEYHLGKRAKILTMILVFLGTLGVCLAYLIVGGQFLSSVFKPLLSGDIFTYTFIYFFLASLIIYFGIRVIARTEFLILFFLLLSLLIIFVFGFSEIKISNILIEPQQGISAIFLPYGPLLFALWGLALIPEVEEMLSEQKKKLSKIVTVSAISVSVFYFLFVLLVLGLSGNQTDQSALQGLKKILPDALVSVSLLMGVFATFAAFITQGIVLKKTLMFDLKIKHWQAFVLTCCPPMILFLLGMQYFIPIISFIGGVILGIEGILILLMYKKIGGRRIIVYPLSLVFLLGIIYEIIYFVK